MSSSEESKKRCKNAPIGLMGKRLYAAEPVETWVAMVTSCWAYCSFFPVAPDKWLWSAVARSDLLGVGP